MIFMTSFEVRIAVYERLRADAQSGPHGEADFLPL